MTPLPIDLLIKVLKILIKKILWTAATEMMVNTSYYREGKLLNNLTERYNWAMGN